MFRNGRPIAALGGAGSTDIFQTIVQVIINMVDFGMNIQEAISTPRISVGNAKDLLNLDEGGGWSDDLINELKKRGHNVTMKDCGEVNGVAVAPSGVLFGAADPRRDCVAIGF